MSGAGIQPIAFEVAAGGSDGVAADVDGGGLARAAGGGVDGEAAGIAEQVQDAPVRGQRADQGPVVALVEKQSALLPVGQVDAEEEIIFAHGDLASGHGAAQGDGGSV